METLGSHFVGPAHRLASIPGDPPPPAMLRSAACRAAELPGTPCTPSIVVQRHGTFQNTVHMTTGTQQSNAEIILIKISTFLVRKQIFLKSFRVYFSIIEGSVHIHFYYSRRNRFNIKIIKRFCHLNCIIHNHVHLVSTEVLINQYYITCTQYAYIQAYSFYSVTIYNLSNNCIHEITIRFSLQSHFTTFTTNLSMQYLSNFFPTSINL